ncbi:DUF294 nucleotidyltransferase-like domain-containing protein [Flavobacterium davisii]|uniref:DUF294 nucleotidyltransferase-like domain-containing protein n=1 Tax=Flavobacterium davisii TaxID=2906077 RepID=UPI002869BAC8|nr:DUF294 nucleotidyltransferase-like domain-containing protein [Flavobacterium davisii]
MMQQALTKNIPLQHLYNVAGEIILAIIHRSVELAILDLGSPPVPFAFLSIGSQGRKEQLLLTDHDNMLIYADVEIQQARNARFYFSQLAKKVAETLEKLGYKHCEFGNSITNEKWCKPLGEWIMQYENWIKSPGNLLMNIVPFFLIMNLYMEIRVLKLLLPIRLIK